MAKFREAQYFIRKNVTPGSLIAGNLISFSYRSPNGVHDKSPLVFVLESRVDRIFGINIHYDMGQMDDILTSKLAEVQAQLEIDWYKKYPTKRNELKKNKKLFDVSMIDKKDLPTLVRRIPKKILEQFSLQDPDYKTTLRCYLYSRMTRVSKLVWKL